MRAANREALVRSTCAVHKGPREVSGITALHLAFATRQEGMIRFLLDKGAQIDYKSPSARASPPTWLINKRLEGVAQDGDAEKVLAIVAMLEHEFDWSVDNQVNAKGKTFMELVTDLKEAEVWLRPVYKGLKAQQK